MPKALRQIRAREEAKSIKELIKELNRKNKFNTLVNKHLSDSILKKHLSTESLPQTVTGDSLNSLLYSTYQDAIVFRVCHITESWVVLEKMEAVPMTEYMYGTDRYTVGKATGNLIKVANKAVRDGCLAIQGVCLSKVDGEGVIYRSRLFR